jgi:hypothetical protein
VTAGISTESDDDIQSGLCGDAHRVHVLIVKVSGQKAETMRYGTAKGGGAGLREMFVCRKCICFIE